MSRRKNRKNRRQREARKMAEQNRQITTNERKDKTMKNEGKGKTMAEQYRYLTMTDYYKMLNHNRDRLYIAYGSNLNMRQMQYRCPDSKPAYRGLLKDYELFYAGSKTGSYATIRPCKGKSVPVGVWEISECDEHYLDQYEGFPTFYYKSTIAFKTADQVEHEAMVYIMRDDAPEGYPSHYYAEVVRQGYRDFGLDERYLNESLGLVG